jgi:ATP-dependent helicase/nuclease subunit A
MLDSRNTDEQSRRIIREELLTNILVEAGAGSGKTQMLAARMAAGVAEGVYQIEHMAAVTFTRKAASELRGRFHLALEARLQSARKAKAPEAEIRRLQAALSNLERFFAGTIHSFCARLLRERPVESGVSPGFTELDEVQDLELRKRVWREFITDAREEGDPDVAALLEADIKLKDLDSAFAKVCDNDDVEFPPGEVECPDPKRAAKTLEEFWKKFQKHMPASIHEDNKCDMLLAAQRFAGQWRVAQRRLHRPAVVADLLDVWDRDSKITMKWWADDNVEKKKIRAAIAALHGSFRADVVEPYLATWQQYIYRLSIRLLTRARSAASKERYRLNSLNYGDLLNLTARVLRENVGVRRALQQKYQYLLVDEFQDTDPVQAEIVFWLAENGNVASTSKKGSPRDWRQVPLRPGALFVVGDPKQSIYRFRRADIDIYNIVRGRFSEKGVGIVLPLTMNFRSGPDLCTWANTVFETCFPKKPTEHAPQFAPLDPNPKQVVRGKVCTLTHHCDRNELMETDAERIAAFIRTEVDAGRRRYSDFLILTRKKKDRIAPYASALESLNIPAEVSGAGAFGESRDVEALTKLLRALADTQDAVALVAVLRGPLFGISDPELFAFKRSGGWFSIFQPEAATGSPYDRIRVALDTLNQYQRWTRVLPAAGALERILEASGYLALAATTPGGVDAGDVLHAVDRVRQVVETGGSLADAADALEADREATSEVESLPLEPGRADVVRLMNLHKAKGLESNVVFLADPAGSVQPWVDVRIERDGLQARGWLKIISKSDTSRKETLIGQHADWDTHEQAELPYVVAQEDRLLYVAATRAREMLVVSRRADKPGDGAWGKLNAFLGKARELSVPASVSVPALVPLDCTTAAQTAAEDHRAQAHARVSQSSWAITSVTEEARHIARMTRSVDAAADDPSKVVAADTPSHRADAGQAWGTLIHGLLEHAMRHKTASRDDLRRLAMWLTVEEPQLRAVIETALDTVETVARAPFWQEARASLERHEEVPFVRRVGEEPVQVLSGTIDLVFKRTADWRLLDYKTDTSATQDELKARYQQQVDAYAEAWSGLAGGDVSADLVSTR